MKKFALHRYLKGSSIALLLSASLILPIVVPTNFGFLPYHLTNSFLLFMLMLFISVGLYSLQISRGYDRSRLTFIDLVFLIFLLFALLRLISHPLSHWTQTGAVSWLVMIVLYFLVKEFPSEDKHRNTYIVLMSVAVVWGLAKQLDIFGVFPTSFFTMKQALVDNNSFIVVSFLCLIFPIAIFQIFLGKKDKKLWLYSLGIFASAFTLLIVLPYGNPGIWFSLFTGLSTILILRYKLSGELRRFTKARIVGIIAGMAGLMTSMIFLFTKIDDGYFDERWLVWKISWNIWKEDFVFGIGLTRFASRFAIEQSDYFRVIERTSEESLASDSNYAHSSFIQLGTELGLLGILLFLLVIISAFYFSKNTSRSIPLKGALATWTILALFFNVLSVPVLSIVLVIILALLSNCQQKKIPSIRSKLPKRFFSPTLIYVFSCLLLLWLSRTYPAISDWKKAYQYHSMGQLKQAHRYYFKTLDGLELEKPFLKQFGECLYDLGEFDKSNMVLNLATDYYSSSDLYCKIGQNYAALRNYQKAEETLLTAHYMVPNSLNPKYLLAKNYYSMGKRKEAAELAAKLLSTELRESNKVSSTVLTDLKLLSAISYDN